MKTTIKNPLALAPSLLAMSLFFVTSCGNSEDPGSKGNFVPNNPHSPPNQEEVKILKLLKDRDADVVNKDLSRLDLKTIDKSLENFPGRVSVTAFSKRSVDNTRPIIVLTQSFFGGASVKSAIDKYIVDTLAANNQLKKNNLIIEISNLGILPDPKNFQIKGKDGNWIAVANPIDSYKSLYKAAALTVDTDNDSNMGALRYGAGTTNVYGPIRDAIMNLVAKLSDKALTDMHSNKTDMSIVAFDPIMASIAIDIAGSLHNIKFVSIPTPIVAFHNGGSYNSNPSDMDKSFANIGYSKDVIANAIKNNKSYKLAFNYLRTRKYFFPSLIGAGEDTSLGYKELEYGILEKYSISKIDGVNFYVATYNDDAEWGINYGRFGFNLVTDNNAQTGVGGGNVNHSLVSIVTDSGRFIEVTDNFLGVNVDPNASQDTFENQPEGFHDFPTIDVDKSAMVGGNNGLVFKALKRY